MPAKKPYLLEERGTACYRVRFHVESGEGKSIRKSFTFHPPQGASFEEIDKIASAGVSKMRADHAISGRVLSGLSGSRVHGQQGAVSELLAAVDLMRRGFEVFRNVNPVGLHDIVALGEETGFIRVEVKTGIVKGGKPYANRIIPDSFDVLAMVTHGGTVIYFDRHLKVIESLVAKRHRSGTGISVVSGEESSLGDVTECTITT